ncbi:hypothetical protein ACQP2T_39395 [Nonomuraea sp. CA-143628]|uniref:hypothetical protein n=1 Tax=Nonomuraea sp. CA-143628 TaxID=3239997 RepID=UPI003D92F17F
MTAPQHRAQLTDRVQRLEAAVFTLSSDLGDVKSDLRDVKAAVDQLPQTIRQHILEYTEPVFGEIMAGNASLATKEQLDQLEQRVNARLSNLDDGLSGLDDRLSGLQDLTEARFSQVDAKLDQLLMVLAQTSPN